MNDISNQGIIKSVFVSGMKDLSEGNSDFLDKIYESVDLEKSGLLKWNQFLQAVKLICSNDLKDKIELFFSIVDADGNGSV